MDLTYRFDYDARDLIRIGIGRRSSIFKVSHSLLGTSPWNSNASPTIRNGPSELVDVARFVLSRQPFAITLAIHGNVVFVTTLELFHRSFNVLHAALLAHLGG